MKHLRKFNESNSGYTQAIEFIRNLPVNNEEYYQTLRDLVEDLELLIEQPDIDEDELDMLVSDIGEYMELCEVPVEKVDEICDILFAHAKSLVDVNFRNNLPPEEGGPTREIEVEGWLTFMDGQDGSYSIALHGTREEAAARIGTDDPQSTYDDGALEPIKFKVILKNGKYIIDPKGAHVSIDG